MRLSAVAQANMETAYGVVVDAQGVLPGPDLKEIGLLATATGAELGVDVLDAAIACRINGCKVILEVPFSVDLDPVELVSLAANIDVDISLLVPSRDDEWEAYTDRLCIYARAWLAHRATPRMVYPVSGYFQYLVAAVLGAPTGGPVATDEYIHARFVAPIPLDVMEVIKERLRAEILAHFDGEVGLREFVIAVGNSLRRQLAIQ